MGRPLRTALRGGGKGISDPQALLAIRAARAQGLQPGHQGLIVFTTLHRGDLAGGGLRPEERQQPENWRPADAELSGSGVVHTHGTILIAKASQLQDETYDVQFIFPPAGTPNG